MYLYKEKNVYSLDVLFISTDPKAKKMYRKLIMYLYKGKSVSSLDVSGANYVSG